MNGKVAGVGPPIAARGDASVDGPDPAGEYISEGCLSALLLSPHDAVVEMTATMS